MSARSSLRMPPRRVHRRRRGRIALTLMVAAIVVIASLAALAGVACATAMRPRRLQAALRLE
ncbi:MAG TPA: hypothetical protein VHF25_06790 [Nitriliruptorales bacterium]|nr:hypothetical protein [Nitriliruptorales bacterium]